MAATYTSVPAGVQRCLELFQKAKSAAQEFPEPREEWDLRERTGRFRVWSLNIGGWQEDAESLDFKLREASHVHQQLLYLLQDLQSLLLDLIGIWSKTMVPWDELPQDNEGDSLEHDSTSTEVDQLLLDIDEVTNDLLGLNIAVRMPSSHDRLAIVTASPALNPAAIYAKRVQEQYTLSEMLSHRLGLELAKRRKYFENRQAYQSNIAKRAGEALGHMQQQTSVDPSSALMRFEDAPEDTDSEDEEEYKSDWWIVQIGLKRRRLSSFPPIPILSRSGHVQCPYCYSTFVVKNLENWREHILDDLKPYICLEDSCEEQYAFTNREDWRCHMRKAHWQNNICPIGECSQSFSELEFLQKHIIFDHGIESIKANDQAVVILSEAPLLLQPCVFCGKYSLTYPEYEDHLLRHFEKLFLLSLPLLDVSDEAGSPDDRAEKPLAGAAENNCSDVENMFDCQKLQQMYNS
ncbi:hypothetical protein NLG97_g6141 [Lecanicillium saksenae]|uniref:Uncharacterized protein n=1 Tax=Lecanicillium saksenae TaxID=468837 RepID=A0ACC1QSU9_9HYPO|nr:hypothetical protein NLG97_g6141 [Lecanicillium saksenae]